MKTAIRLAVLMVLLASCASRNVFQKKEMTINNELNLTLDNTAANSDFLSLFGIDEKAEVVHVKFDASGDFRVEYKSNYLGRNGFRAFDGKFKKNYYEIYLNKKNVFLPPVYCNTNIDRVWLTVLNDSTLVVDKYINRSGMVLLFAAGTDYRTQYSYSKSKS